MRTKQLRRALECECVSVRSVPADGDCFYRALCLASAVDGASVSDLRALVAESYDEEKFQCLKLYASILPGMFTWVRKCKDLIALQQRVKIDKRVWADDYAIQSLCDHYRLMILIYDEAADKETSKYVSIRPISYSDDTRTVVLNRTKREHYNLIACGDNVCFSTQKDLPNEVITKWSLRKRSPSGIITEEVRQTTELNGNNQVEEHEDETPAHRTKKRNTRNTSRKASIQK